MIHFFVPNNFQKLSANTSWRVLVSTLQVIQSQSCWSSSIWYNTSRDHHITMVPLRLCHILDDPNIPLAFSFFKSNEVDHPISPCTMTEPEPWLTELQNHKYWNEIIFDIYFHLSNISPQQLHDISPSTSSIVRLLIQKPYMTKIILNLIPQPMEAWCPHPFLGPSPLGTFSPGAPRGALPRRCSSSRPWPSFSTFPGTAPWTKSVIGKCNHTIAYIWIYANK